MLRKVKLWIKEAGFVSVIYFVLFVLTLAFGDLVLGLIGLRFLTDIVAGVFLGIFGNINWLVIVKLWNEKVKPEIQILSEKVEDKIKK